jgi:hypothetical protein
MMVITQELDVLKNRPDEHYEGVKSIFRNLDLCHFIHILNGFEHGEQSLIVEERFQIFYLRGKHNM